MKLKYVKQTNWNYKFSKLNSKSKYFFPNIFPLLHRSGGSALQSYSITPLSQQNSSQN